MRKNNQGFSLVELIIVIAIMAVLVGILTPQYLRYLNHSKVASDIYDAERCARKIGASIADNSLLNNSANTINDLVGISPEWKASGGADVVTWDEEMGVTRITLDGYEIFPNPSAYKIHNHWD